MHPTSAPTKAAPANVDLAAAAKATQALVLASLGTVKQAEPTETPQPAPAPAVIESAPVRMVPPAETSAPIIASPQPAPASEAAPSAPAARPVPRRSHVVSAPPPTDPWRAALRDMLAALGVTEQRPAPVEERSVGSSTPRSTTAAMPPAPQKVAPAIEAPVPEVARGAAPVITAPAYPPERIAVAQPRATSPRVVAREESNADLLRYQAHHLLTIDVPRTAAMAQNDMAPVLWNAAGAEQPAQARAVLNAALGNWPSERAPITAQSVSARGQYLYIDAKQAFALGRDQEALDLALRAFAASPRDPEIAGFLALLHLRIKPMQPEMSRQLALYALAASGATRSVRLEDWNTFAVASALSGHESDAARAMLAELALTNDIERSCRAALGAYNMYGERLRGAVQAMLYRVHAQGRDRDSSACRWGTTRSVRYAGVESGRF